MKRHNYRSFLFYMLGLATSCLMGYLLGRHGTGRDRSRNIDLDEDTFSSTGSRRFLYSTADFPVLEADQIPSENAKDDKEEGIGTGTLSPVDFLTVVGIVLILIALTLAFEFLKEFLEESVEEEFEIILEKFFGELTVLGFLAMVTFLFSKTGLAGYLSHRIFGQEEELLEYFEYVHFALFFIMIFFVLQVLRLIRFAEHQQKTWTSFDIRIRNEQILSPNQNLTAEEREILNTLHEAPWYTLVSRHFWFDSKQKVERHEEIAWRALRREFILDRSLDPPFAPIDQAKQLDSTFHFGRYLGLAQIHVLGHAIEVEQETWLFFAGATILYYVIGTAVKYDEDILGYIWILIGWTFYALDLVFAGRLMKLRLMLVPRQADAVLLNETAELSANTSEAMPGNVDDLPAWCFVNYRKALENRPWLTKWLIGGTPNRQQIHFWLDRHGPHYYTTILQTELVFTGVYASLLLIEFFPHVFRNYFFPISALYVILAVLPLVGIMLNKKSMIPWMAQVSSIGTYRKDQIVRDVLLEEKTARIVRTFLVINHIRHIAEKGLPQLQEGSEHADLSDAPSESEFSAMEVEEIGRTFEALDEDSSGHISREEFREVLTRLGASMDDEKFDRIVASLDTDGDGEVNRAEFINWYRYNSQRDHASPAEQAQELFHNLDDNKSGEITLGEFKHKLDTLNMGFSLDEVGAILHQLDHDSTGSIDEHEFELFVTKYYPKEMSSSVDRSNVSVSHSGRRTRRRRPSTNRTTPAPTSLLLIFGLASVFLHGGHSYSGYRCSVAAFVTPVCRQRPRRPYLPTPILDSVATKIDGKAISADIRREIKDRVARHEEDLDRVPGLAVILVGSRRDSQTYVNMKKKACAAAGIRSEGLNFDESVSDDELLSTVEKLNQDESIHGILIQLPLPRHIDQDRILQSVDPVKDVDGLHPVNVAKLQLYPGNALAAPFSIPCTPLGCLVLLERAGVDLSGKHCVVIGRSALVGLPMARLLLGRDATVTICHSKTPDLGTVVQQADVVVAAIGKANLVQGPWIKPGAVVLDVGINSVEIEPKEPGGMNYKLVGDVDFASASEVASLITPVPGGVGPMTIAMLLNNTLKSFEQTLS